MKIQKGVTAWSDSRQVSMRTYGTDRVDLRVEGGWQFIDLKELERMVKELKREARP